MEFIINNCKWNIKEISDEEMQYNNGKDELARYFLAQINEVPTFTVDSDINYYEGYYNFKAKIEKIRNILKEIK